MGFYPLSDNEFFAQHESDERDKVLALLGCILDRLPLILNEVSSRNILTQMLVKKLYLLLPVWHVLFVVEAILPDGIQLAMRKLLDGCNT